MNIMAKQYQFLDRQQRRTIVLAYEAVSTRSVWRQNLTIRELGIKYGVKQVTIRKVINDYYRRKQAEDQKRIQQQFENSLQKIKDARASLKKMKTDAT